MAKNMYQKRKERKEQRENNEEVMDNKININWYPGHMVKTKREIQNNLKLIDIVVELLDARVPMSSKNPDIDELVGTKKRITVLNKCDLANDEENQKWIEYFKSKNINSVLVDSLSGKGMKQVVDKIYELNKDRANTLANKGIVNSTIKIAVVGIPNVGKSSFINKLVNKNIAKTGNRPGVTKTNQWVRINKDILLLDTPGVLWPKFEESIGLNLCYCGCIKDEIIDIETISYMLVEKLEKNKYESGLLRNRYKIPEEFEYNELIELLNLIGKNRGALVSGGNIDYLKVGHMILDEFQTGKIGKITLEKVGER